MSLDEDSRLRAEFMDRLYEETEYPTSSWVDPDPIGVRIDIESSSSSLYLLVEHLVHAGFVEKAYDEEVRLTDAGVREVLKTRSAAQSTEQIPPNVFVNVGRDVYGLQAGTIGSTQNVIFGLGPERKAIEAFLAELRTQLDQLPLSVEQLEDLTEDLETAEAQLRRPRPRPAILQAAVSSLREVVLGAAGSGAVTGLVELAQHIHF